MSNKIDLELKASNLAKHLGNLHEFEIRNASGKLNFQVSF
jgi:hypothetical protein